MPFLVEGLNLLPAFCLFVHKTVRNSSLRNVYKKPYRTWLTAIKAFKTHQSAPERTHKKSQILLRRFLDEHA